MWTYRLTIRLEDDEPRELYGAERVLIVLRDRIRRIGDEAPGDVLTYRSNGRTVRIPVGKVVGMSDIEPTIRPRSHPEPARS